MEKEDMSEAIKIDILLNSIKNEEQQLFVWQRCRLHKWPSLKKNVCRFRSLFSLQKKYTKQSIINNLKLKRSNH